MCAASAHSCSLLTFVALSIVYVNNHKDFTVLFLMDIWVNSSLELL